MHKPLYSFAAVVVSALAGTALADDGNTLGAPVNSTLGVNASTNVTLKSLDTNHDGKISKDEAAANPALAEQFDKLDTNHDGSLSKAEFAKFETSAKGSAGKKPSKTDKSEPADSDSGAAPKDSGDTAKPAP